MNGTLRHLWDHSLGFWGNMPTMLGQVILNYEGNTSTLGIYRKVVTMPGQEKLPPLYGWPFLSNDPASNLRWMVILDPQIHKPQEIFFSLGIVSGDSGDPILDSKIGWKNQEALVLTLEAHVFSLYENLLHLYMCATFLAAARPFHF